MHGSACTSRLGAAARPSSARYPPSSADDLPSHAWAAGPEAGGVGGGGVGGGGVGGGGVGGGGVGGGTGLGSGSGMRSPRRTRPGASGAD